MFSFNEDVNLGHNKRRIIQFVEETIPEDLLDLGVTVLAMQVSCRAPGCVPLETVLTIMFPPSNDELMIGIPESKNGGTFSTKILLPMSEVRKNDILHALPPAFEGGLQTMESLCLRARDVMLAQITNFCTSQKTKYLIAQYLQQCLQEFMENNCEVPEYGKPMNNSIDKLVDDQGKAINVAEKEKSDTITELLEVTEKKESETLKIETNSKKSSNIVIQRDLDDICHRKQGSVRDATIKNNIRKSKNATSSLKTETKNLDSNLPSHPPREKKYGPSANDWRRQQNIVRKFDSQTLLSKVVAAEHSPGIRNAGCPCCDPDNPKNIIDSMML